MKATLIALSALVIGLGAAFASEHVDDRFL